MMEDEMRKVKEFHLGIGEKVANSIELLDSHGNFDLALAVALRELIAQANRQQHHGSHLRRRALMAIEELTEWIEAHLAGDLVAAADALADRLYVLLGDAVATGMPLERLFDEVHHSNMTKSSRREATGKGIKGDGFRGPRLGIVLGIPVERSE